MFTSKFFRFNVFLQQNDNVVEFPEKGHRIRRASSVFYIGRSIPEDSGVLKGRLSRHRPTLSLIFR